MKFPTARVWVDHLKRLILNDYDDVVLFTGKEGSGKSTHAFQIARAVDPTFDARRVAFDIPTYLKMATRADPGQAVLFDEARLNRRRVMKRENVAFIEWLQVSRSRNLHQFLCFPHLELLDDAVKATRIRYRVHVTGRKRAVVQRPVKRTWKTRTGTDIMSVDWPAVGAWTFARNSGPSWDLYLMAKKAATEEHSKFADRAASAQEPEERAERTSVRVVQKRPRPAAGRLDPSPAWDEVLRDVQAVELGRGGEDVYDPG